MTPFEAGQSSYQTNVPNWKNPFPVRSRQYYEWLEGWWFEAARTNASVARGDFDNGLL